jgi:hypothetical protein
MSKIKGAARFVGFVAFWVTIVSCGAHAVSTAADMFFDNSGTGLKATTVQGALEELAPVTADEVVGKTCGPEMAWGPQNNERWPYGYQFTFNSDETYDATIPVVELQDVYVGPEIGGDGWTVEWVKVGDTTYSNEYRIVFGSALMRGDIESEIYGTNGDVEPQMNKANFARDNGNIFMIFRGAYFVCE